MSMSMCCGGVRENRAGSVGSGCGYGCRCLLALALLGA